MKRWISLLIGLTSLLGIGACSHVREYMDIARSRGVSEAYLSQLSRWTRSQIVHSQFETRVRIEATYLSPEFNRAYLDEYARLYRLSDAEKRTRAESDAAQAAQSAEFLFYAYIPEKASNDFDRKGTIWSVFLTGSGGEKILPTELKRIDPLTPVVQDLFPYVHAHYGITYRLRFPASAAALIADPSTKLVFTGVVGTVELAFGGR